MDSMSTMYMVWITFTVNYYIDAPNINSSFADDVEAELLCGILLYSSQQLYALLYLSYAHYSHGLWSTCYRKQI